MTRLEKPRLYESSVSYYQRVVLPFIDKVEELEKKLAKLQHAVNTVAEKPRAAEGIRLCKMLADDSDVPRALHCDKN